MNVNGRPYRTIWLKEDDSRIVQIIDQRNLPHEFNVEDIETVEQMALAISEMHVRGAGLIGASAGYGMYLATLAARDSDDFSASLDGSYERLKATRPTAVNLVWALDRQMVEISKAESTEDKIAIALRTAQEIADEDASFCRRLGEHGLPLIREISESKNGEPVNLLLIATQDGLPSSTTARRRLQFTPPTTQAFPSTFTSTKPAPAIKALA